VIALSQEEVLQEALEDQKREAMDLNKKAIRYGVLKREAESNKQVFDVVLNRLKETDLTRGLKASNITVVDPAEVPRYPVRPRKKLNVLLAAIIGLMGGIGLAFFFEYLDDTVKTPVSDVIHDGLMQGLRIIPCGQRPPNPSELFGSPQMQSLLNELRTTYDYIIMDSPPLAAVTDSVINNIDVTRKSYYYYYQYYYYSYYGDDDEGAQAHVSAKHNHRPRAHAG